MGDVLTPWTPTPEVTLEGARGALFGGDWRGEMVCRDVGVLVGRTGIVRAEWTRDGLEGEWTHQNLLQLL